MMGWDHRQYGSAADPIHQSDLNDISSAYGCSKRFQLRKEAEAIGVDPEWETTGAKRCLGTAVHEALRLYLTGEPGRRVLAGVMPRDEAIDHVVRREFEAAVGELDVRWKNASPEAEFRAAVHMVRGVLRDMAVRASEIALCEAPFRVIVEAGAKEYVLEGTVDLVYRARESGALVLTDWKSGDQKLPQVILDHGYQLGIYSHALAEGTFFPGTEDELRIGQFPDEMYVAHLRDFVPYSKVTEKVIARPEEAAFFGVEIGTKVSVAPAGGRPAPKLRKDGTPYKKRERKTYVVEVDRDQRGPVWYAARRTEQDIARLKHSLRKLVGGVRLGVLYENISEQCDRCVFKARCLNDGYGVAGDERKALEQMLGEMELDGLDGLEQVA